MPKATLTVNSVVWMRVVLGLTLAGINLAGCGDMPMENAPLPRTTRSDAGRRDVVVAADAGGPGYEEPDVLSDSETCGNGFDDNADGRVDEDCPCLPGATQRCYAGNPMEPGRGACQFGVQRCTGSGEFGRWDACAGAVGPVPEVCDNIDNNCDGRIDEALSRGCSASCGAGTQTCAAGAWAACSPATPCSDAGVIVDGGMPTNTTCRTAIDVTPRGRGDVRTVSGTTCGGSDLVHLVCNRATAPEVFYLWHAPDEPYAVHWTITPGFATGLAQDDEACRPTTVDCDTSDEADYAHEHTLVVERVGGGCGAFTLTVTRSF